MSLQNGPATCTAWGEWDECSFENADFGDCDIEEFWEEPETKAAWGAVFERLAYQ